MINPNVSGLADWNLKAHETRTFRYRVLLYHGPAIREALAARAVQFGMEK